MLEEPPTAEQQRLCSACRCARCAEREGLEPPPEEQQRLCSAHAADVLTEQLLHAAGVSPSEAPLSVIAPLGEAQQALLDAARFSYEYGGEVFTGQTLAKLEERLCECVRAALLQAARQQGWEDACTDGLLAEVCAFHVDALRRQTLITVSPEYTYGIR